MALQKFEVKGVGLYLIWNYYVHIRYPNLQLVLPIILFCMIKEISRPWKRL